MPLMEQAIDQAILAYSRARSIGFTLEFFLLDSLSSVVPGTKNSKAKRDPKLFSLLQQDLFQFLKQDAQNIRRGVYPISVLAPEAPLSHLNRLPKLVLDGMGIYRRKKSGKTTEFGKAARELLDELPRYYRRNFHFQTEGYLSQRSAELYEHQVELLFGGAADAMRRLVIPALREKFGSSDGKGLRFLEIAAGTGRASRFVSLAFPKAKIVLTDLSEPYLKEAQKKLSAFHKFDYVQADGAHLPFQDGHFDAAYSVFLFHELPRADRKAVLKESKRVLKEDGVLTLVDSTQIGDLSGIDEVLKAFPEQYHEPFYRDYIENPMEGLIEAEGFSDVHSSRGFLSKVCSARARRIQTKSTTDAGIRK
jgi:ubiquinone/menaquinone biosynthesis C-methylase UbiE